MDPEIERHYRVLNLLPTASPEQVYQAYRDLVRVWDPQRFANQPHLELMAEAKLKEIIDAYNALASTGEVSATPAPKPPPELLNPVPDHIIDQHAPQPLFTPDPPVAAEFGRTEEEPPAPEPMAQRPWEQMRPMSYPKPEPQPIPPAIQFTPPRPAPPVGSRVLRLAVQFSVFLVPVWLAALGLYLYTSNPSRVARENELATPPVRAEVKTPAPGTHARHLPKRSAEPVEEKPEATPISLPTGTDLVTPRGRTGAGRFRIANRSGQDAVVRVAEQGAPGTPLRLVYVQASTEVPIAGIGTGVYIVSVSLGPLTKGPRTFATTLGPFQFMQIESVEGPQSDEYQIILKPTQ
jgi:hypothetical protein